MGVLSVQRAQKMRRQAAGFDIAKFIQKVQEVMGGNPTVVRGKDEEDQNIVLGSPDWEKTGRIAMNY